MPVTAIVGAQWGDEGKGRVIDYLAETADMVIRFQGGDNAGHTVVNDLGLFRLHLVPSGIFYPATCNIVGAGTVVNPASLLAEMQTLAEAGVDLANLWLSDRAHMVMPYHVQLDGLQEAARGGGAIGTRRFMPPESSRGYRSAAPLKPTVCSFSSTTRRISDSGSAVCSRSGRATLSKQVRSVNSAPFWSSTPMPRRSRFSARAPMVSTR